MIGKMTGLEEVLVKDEWDGLLYFDTDKIELTLINTDPSQSEMLQEYCNMYCHQRANALKNVMYKGQELVDVQFELMVLSDLELVFILLSILALKKHRNQ